jgi:hypothetical protein
MKALPKKETRPATDTGRNPSNSPTSNSANGSLQVTTGTLSRNEDKVSWRNYYAVHPAAEIFPRLSPNEQSDLAKDIEKNGLKVAIQTREVAGEIDTYVTDGRERLDAMESLGWQIVNDKGEWIGVLAHVPGAVAKVEHRHGYTHEKVAAEVIGYNIRRRHLTADQRAMLVAKLRGGELSKQARDRQTAHLRKGDQLPVGLKTTQRGRTREQLAEDCKVSVHKMRTALDVVKNENAEVVDAIIAGKKRLADAKAKDKDKQTRKGATKKQPTFENEVWHKWELFIKKFPIQQRRAVKKLVHEWSA